MKEAQQESGRCREGGDGVRRSGRGGVAKSRQGAWCASSWDGEGCAGEKDPMIYDCLCWLPQ